MEIGIKQILELAVNAPSGDNSQPWHFKVNNRIVEIINLPERDNRIFNFQQRGSYIAHGALLENIRQLAPVYGYKIEVTLLPGCEGGQGGQVIARVMFSDGPTNPDKTAIETIKLRCTNRKKYRSSNLDENLKRELLSLPDYGRLVIEQRPENKLRLANAASLAEKTMLLYKPLHDAFFSMIRWDSTDERQKGYGLLIDTLELLPPQKLLFKWLSNWRSSAALRKMNLPNIIAKENASTYATASAFGAIVMENNSAKDFIRTGMTLEKLWLKITEAGLSLQPIAGVIYLQQRIKEEGIGDLPSNLREEILTGTDSIYNNFQNPGGIITMMFRFGEAELPAARSAKFFPVVS